MPVELTVAMVVVDENHVPPVLAEANVVTDPRHAPGVPVMAAGKALMVTVFITVQPAPSE